MRIFMPCVHPRRTRGVAQSLDVAGASLYVAGESFTEDLGHHRKYSLDNAIDQLGPNVGVYEGQDIFDDPPDVVIVGREDSERQILDLVVKLRASKPVVVCAYSGNFHSHFVWEAYDGAICTDIASHNIARVHGIPSLEYRPMFSFDSFPYQPGHKQEGKLTVRSYIQTFEQRYPMAFRLHQSLMERYTQPGWEFLKIENVEGRPLTEVRDLMRESDATLHIKDQEGFGWSILESLSTGRPLILQRGLAKNMSFEQWAVEGETALFFDSLEDLDGLLRSLNNDPQRLVDLQRSTAANLRRNYRAYDSARELSEFLDLLTKRARMSWMPRAAEKSKIIKHVHGHIPSLDPLLVQGYQMWTAEGPSGEGFFIPAAAMHTSGIRKPDTSVVISNWAGRKALCWGLNLALHKGTYSVRFHVTSDSGSEVYCDVAKHRQGEPLSVIWSCPPVKLSQAQGPVEGQITVDDETSRYEFRLMARQPESITGDIRFIGVELLKVETVGDDLERTV